MRACVARARVSVSLAGGVRLATRPAAACGRFAAVTTAMGRGGRRAIGNHEWTNWRQASADRLEERRAAQLDPSRGPQAARAAVERIQMMRSDEARRLVSASGAASSSEPFALGGAAERTNVEAELNVHRE